MGAPKKSRGPTGADAMGVADVVEDPHNEVKWKPANASAGIHGSTSDGKAMESGSSVIGEIVNIEPSAGVGFNVEAGGLRSAHQEEKAANQLPRAPS